MEIYGKEVITGPMCISIAGNKKAIDYDSISFIASMGNSSGEIRELWFNAGNGLKVRVLGTASQFKELGVSLIRSGG